MSIENSYILVGAITSAHGIKGAVKVKSFTADPMNIVSFSKLYAGEQYLPISLKLVGQKGNMLIVKLEGLDDRNKAEELIGTQLYVEKNALPELEQDEFYYIDLVGLQVINNNNDRYGTVTKVEDFGAGAIIEIKEANSEKRILYPFKKSIFPTVDIQNKQMTICKEE